MKGFPASYFSDFFFVLGDGRKKLPILLLMMLCAAFLDLLGLGLIAPLIIALTNGSTGSSTLLSSLTAVSAHVQPTMLIVLVIGVFIVKAVAGYWIQKGLVRFSEEQRSQLMQRLLASYLAKPYEYHLERNTADMVNTTIYTTWSYSNGTLSTALKLLTDGIMFLFIVGFLAWVNWQAVLVIGGILALLMALYGQFAKSRIAAMGEAVTSASAMIIREVTHALGALREVRILGVEDYCLSQLKTHTSRFAVGNSTYGALSIIPRYVIEFSTVALLLGIALLVTTGQLESAAVVPVLGLFGIAAIRLTPGVMGIVSSLNSLRLTRYALRELARDLRDVGASGAVFSAVRHDIDRPMPFRELSFEGVSYTYPGTPKPAIENLSFSIKAGQSVGLIGRSGSGKSTTADVLLGFLMPQRGQVLVDGVDIQKDTKCWTDRLAYIPQTTYLTDDTLQANIAFGIPAAQVDAAKLRSAIQAARLEEVLSGLPLGLKTVIGERGVRLSGGQRQRVALARAFYHDRDFIVMDEATASLDNETEQEVVNAIRNLHGYKTLVIIAHRLTTLEGCDLILRMEDGQIVERGDYESIVRKHAMVGHG